MLLVCIAGVCVSTNVAVSGLSYSVIPDPDRQQANTLRGCSSAFGRIKAAIILSIHGTALLCLQAFVSALLLLSLVSATASSLTLTAYSPQHPKRVFLQHLTRNTATGPQTVYAAASSDATDVNIALKELHLNELASHGHDWLVNYHPISLQSFVNVCQTWAPSPAVFRDAVDVSIALKRVAADGAGAVCEYIAKVLVFV